jgi:hypothetical protein
MASVYRQTDSLRTTCTYHQQTIQQLCTRTLASKFLRSCSAGISALLTKLENVVISHEVGISDTYGHSQLRTGHPVRSAIYKQLNGRLVLRWVTTWESLLLYVLLLLPPGSSTSTPSKQFCVWREHCVFLRPYSSTVVTF